MDKKYLPLFFLFLFQMLTFLSASSIEVNNTEIDSLTRLLNQKTGIDKIAFELDIALDIINSDKEQALIFTNSALSASKTLANKNLEIRSYYTLGRIYTDMGKNSLAVANFDTALYIAEETADIEYKADILFRRGVVEHRLGEDIQALKSFNASVISGLLSENFRIMGASYSMMGTIWRMNGKYDQAIEYIIKSKLNYEKAGFTEGHGWATYLLGRICFDLKLFVTALD